MKLFRLTVFIGAVLIVLSGAQAALAQKKAAPKRAQKKSRVKRAVKPPAKPLVTETPLVPVTRIDFAGLQTLLKREPDAKRPLLVNFWATWCDPCREEFPALVKIDADYRSRGLDFVTVSLDDLAEIKRDVPKFLFEMKAEMPAYLLKTADEDAAIQTVAPDWRGGLPFTILFDASGKIAYSRMGVVKPDILRAEIEKVLAVQAQSKLPNQDNSLNHGKNDNDAFGFVLHFHGRTKRGKVNIINQPPVIESVIIKKQ